MTDPRLAETMSRLEERTHGRGTDDELLKHEGIIVRLSDVLILLDKVKHLMGE